MQVYKYICKFCGNIHESTSFLGMKCTCGKCRREQILIDANQLLNTVMLKRVGQFHCWSDGGGDTVKVFSADKGNCLEWRVSLLDSDVPRVREKTLKTGTYADGQQIK